MPAINLPNKPLVLGVIPETMPIVFFILYPGTVGVVTIMNPGVSGETEAPQLGQNFESSGTRLPQTLQIIDSTNNNQAFRDIGIFTIENIVQVVSFYDVEGQLEFEIS